MRSSPRLLLANAVPVLVAAVPSAMVLWSALGEGQRSTLESGMALVASVILAGSPIRWLHPYLWTSYELLPDGLRTTTGAIERRSSFIPWTHITSIRVARPLTWRLAGLSKVTVVGRGSEGSCVLEGVDRRVVEEIRELAAVSVPGRAQGGTARRDSAAPEVGVVPADAAATTPRGGRGAQVVSSPAGGRLVFRASLADQLWTSLVQCQWLLFVPFLFAALDHVTEVLSVLGRGEGVDVAGVLAVTRDAPVVTAIAVVFAALAYGFAHTIIRWYRFAVYATSDGLVIRTGLLASELRQISLTRLAGVEVRRGPIARLTGRAQLRVHSSRHGGGVTSHTIVPYGSYGRVVRPLLQSEHLGQRGEALSHRTIWQWAHLIRPARTALLLAAFVLLVARAVGYSIWLGVLVVTAVLVVDRTVVRLEVRAGGRVLVANRGLLWTRAVAVPAESINAVDLVAVAPLARGGVVEARVEGFTGQPYTFRASGLDPRSVAHLARVSQSSAQREQRLPVCTGEVLS